MKLSTAFYFFQLWLFILSRQALAHTVTFYVHNKCPFPIWPATASNTGQPVIADGGFYLASGDTRIIEAPWSWSGRIWGRTGCNFAYNWKPACETGDCDGRLQCNGLIGTPPATLVEITLQADKGKPNFYDVSLVDGYNLPCNGDTKANIAKMHNLWLQEESKIWLNEYGTPEKCKPNLYSKIFKDACPAYFSYAFDMPSPLISCASKEHVITFCPSGWGKMDANISSI
ncbi:hypothetical protein Patl1_22066 [Pistacia atlantica]|uniref:Uncharacterized protein n=1 Tax=Pistacia atlantica TaxID=434234 RepID=A0ACC1BK82_9ROSI|nr:hypothetical protein Patl1_22066 [Pistacia atlantica]